MPATLDLFDYFTGGWLEEHGYALLYPLKKKGLLADIRIGLRTSIPTSSNNQGKTKKAETLYQELDLCYTDGHEFYVVECKSGSVKQEAIQKLENIVRKYGGVHARGIISSCFPPDPTNQERIDNTPTLSHAYPEELTDRALPQGQSA